MRLLIILSSLVLTFFPQDTEKQSLSVFYGHWNSASESFGMPSVVTMTWDQALHNRFARITYRIDMKNEKGRIVTFEGTAFYKQQKDGSYAGAWFDSNGEIHPIAATLDSNTLTSIWGTKETKLGKTIYRLIDEHTVEIVDWILKKDGTWKEFNRSIVYKTAE